MGQQLSDWIAHDGKGMPVDGMTRVIPQFRADPSAAQAEHEAGGRGISAHSYSAFWTHDGGMADIIAYRVAAGQPK